MKLFTTAPAAIVLIGLMMTMLISEVKAASSYMYWKQEKYCKTRKFGICWDHGWRDIAGTDHYCGMNMIGAPPDYFISNNGDYRFRKDGSTRKDNGSIGSWECHNRADFYGCQGASVIYPSGTAGLRECIRFSGRRLEVDAEETTHHHHEENGHDKNKAAAVPAPEEDKRSLRGTNEQKDESN